MRARVSAERLMDAPAEVIYHCIADYRQHHRPEGFLPPVFSGFMISRGGVGAGTEARWVVDIGGRKRTIMATISEPVPGRTIVESRSGVETTFTVEPSDDRRTLSRFDTVIEEPGLRGLLNRLFVGRILGPVYDDELRRLQAYAQGHDGLLPTDHRHSSEALAAAGA